jgi:hypothetical protein
VQYEGSAPTIDTIAFPGTPVDIGFWSSAPVTTGWAIWAGFGDGTMNSGNTYFTELPRCVRGRPAADLASSTRFSTLATGDAVLDNATGLVWEQSRAEGVDWEDALSYCTSLQLDGSEDWRLPTVHELHSLVEHEYFNPATSFPDAFPDQASHAGYPFWTSTTAALTPSSAWVVAFYSGNSASEAKTTATSYYARCVRGG